MSEPEKEHIIKAFQFEVGKSWALKSENRWLRYSTMSMVTLQYKLQKEGIPAPEQKGGSPVTKESPNVSQERTEHMAKNSIKSRKIAILAAEG